MTELDPRVRTGPRPPRARGYRGREPQAGDVAFPQLRVPLLRRAHHQLPALSSGPASPCRTQRSIYDIPFTSVSSFVLLMSSLTMVSAHNALEPAGRQRDTHLAFRPPPPLAPCSSAARSSSSRLHRRRGMTLAHQPGRLGLLPAHRIPWDPRRHRRDHASLALRDLDADEAAQRPYGLNLELVGLYWHFVDIIWIVIFTVVYLLPVPPV